MPLQQIVAAISVCFYPSRAYTLHLAQIETSRLSRLPERCIQVFAKQRIP